MTLTVCAKLAVVQGVTSKGLVRIGLGLVVLFLAVKFLMCHCGWGRLPMNSIPACSSTNLHRHVQYLAGELGEHNVLFPDKLKLAADYIEREWRIQGHAVKRLPYRVGNVECDNLEITFPGNSEVIVVGAHYDSVHGAPGANDNGSGVAALLELSRQLRSTKRTVRFVVFVNEEPPYFQTELMGSRVYAKACRQRGDDIRAMISLETMGYFSDAPGSQQFPSPLFRLFFPGKGNFIAFVSNLSSKPVMRRAVQGFRGTVDFPVECIATWERIVGIGWSDHSSFWHEGYPAFQVSDTAPFRYPHYHTPEDTPDKLDYEKLARVTAGIHGAILALANE